MNYVILRNVIVLVFVLLTSTGPVQPINADDSQVHNGLNLNQTIDSNDSIIENIVISPLEPTINQDITVEADATDPNNLTNVFLFWKYDSFNTSFNNVSMSKGGEITPTGESFSSTSIADVVLDSGIFGGGGGNDWHYGNYSLDNWEISNIDLTIDDPPGDNIVYYKIQIKNANTNNWETVAEDGSSGGYGDLALVSYSLDDKVNGINIYSESYDTPSAALPVLDLSFTAIPITYSAEIPGLPEPSFVSYYIQANDSLGNIIDSDINSFLINSKPGISSYSIPHLIYPKNNTIPVNVTVSDPDGYEGIGSDGVVFYYRLLGNEIWSFSNLVFSKNISLTESIYAANITYDPPMPLESFLEISINVTDTVDGMVGYSDSTTDSIILDFKGPTLTAIDLLDLVDPSLNATGFLDPLVMEVEFADLFGISDVSVFYRVTNTTQYVDLPMMNMSNLSINDNTEVYNVTLPAADEDAFVYFYFEAKDFLNNTNATPVNYYYADGIGPVVYDNDIMFKSIVSNFSSNAIVFNTTDASGVNETGSLLFYRLDNLNDTIWYNTSISPINYGSIIDYQETFTASDLPVYIRKGENTNLTIEVSRFSKIQQALMTVEFTHEQSSDLRMWIQTSDAEVLIFDRIAGVDTINVDLLEMGFHPSDFDNDNFTLVIQDFSEDYFGSIDSFEIELINYELPFPYQYSAEVASTVNDTSVSFYISMLDIFGNRLNSSIMGYHSDALAPTITLISIPSTVDLEGAQNITIEAIVSDLGGIQNVEIYYSISKSSWIIQQMYIDAETGYFRYDIIPENSSGEISFYIRAYDLIGYQSISNITSFEFENGLGPIISVYGDPFGIDPVDMQKSAILPILANVTDNGNIVSVNLFYRFDAEEEWSNITMIIINGTSTYEAIIELPDTKGKIFFKILAIDNENLITETQEYTILYENAESSLGNILLWGGAAIGVAALVFLLFKLFSSGKIAGIISKRP